MKVFEGQEAVLWQPGDKLTSQDYLVVTCLFQGQVEAIRLYKSLDSLQQDEAFWRPLVTEALSERGDTDTRSVLDDMLFCSDVLPNKHYFFIHLAQVTETM